MNQTLHNNCKILFTYARLFLIILFSLFFFDGFSQNINVNIILRQILLYGNNGEQDCDDGSVFSSPDPRLKLRLVFNGTNYDYNHSVDEHCLIGGVTWFAPDFPNYYLWYESPVGGDVQNSLIAVELDAWEYDLLDANDASCGGYQTVLPINTFINQFPYCNTFYQDSITCSSDGTARQWGFFAFVEWQFKELFPGTIETDKYICANSSQPTIIRSVTLGTDHDIVDDIWQLSTNGTTGWLDIGFGIDSISYNLGLLPVGTTRYIRRKKETTCQPINTFPLAVPGLNSISVPPPVYSNICTIHVIAPPSIPAAAIPSQTMPDCGSFTLTNPIDPLNNTVPFHWEFQTSLNNGSSWLAPVYTMPTINSNNTTANRTVCIRLRSIYEFGCDTIPWQSYCWFQYANPKAPTINTMYPDPATPLLCNGDGGVWATFNSGTGNGSNQYQYTVNGTTWLAYTPGQVIPVPINRDIEIRGRRVASAPSCNTTAWSTLAFWPRNTIVGPVGAITAPSLNTKTPNTASVCKGTDVSATINPGSGGGPRPNTQREFSIDGGTTWNTYTSGATIATTNAVDSVLIRARRNDGYGTAPLYRLHCSTDWQVIAKWDVINPLVSLQSFSMPLCYAVNPFADIAASDPTPGVGIWSIQNGTGSLSSTSSLNPIITGLTAGSATTIRWSVTQSGCTKNFDTTITPIATSIANLTNGGLCQTCPVKNGNSYNFYDNTGKLIAKIEDLATPITELSTTEVCVGIDATVQTVLTNLNIPQPYLQRHFSIKPIYNTNTNVTLYFSAAEFNDLKTSAMGTSFAFTNVNQLFVSKFPGGENNIYTLPNTSGGIYLIPTTSGFDAINNYYFITIPVTTFSTFYIHPTNDLSAVLPVELSYFSSVCENNKIKIEWQTVSENNNKYFEIERSDNAIDFTNIISVPTQNGNSNQIQNYLVYDNEPKNAKLYYRLKQIDKDGRFTYSKIVTVSCQYSSEKNIVVFVYPNPTENVLNVFINSIEEASAAVKFYDLNTSLIFQKQIDITTGNNLLDISLQNVPYGMYFVEISNSNGVLYKNKIIKQ